jgi:tricorn protease
VADVKRYEGGRQQDVWVYDLARHSSQRITETERSTDNFPMYVGDRIYFTSDRGPQRKLNIWVHDTRTGQQTQVTRHEEFDVLWPSRGEGGIVYENARLDLAPESRHRPEPQAVHHRAGRPAVHHAEVGERAEPDRVGGDLAQRQPGRIRGEGRAVHGAGAARQHREPVAHARRARTVGNLVAGRRLDRLPLGCGRRPTGVRRADGSGDPRRLVRCGAWITRLAWSPDSRSIAFADNGNRLQVVSATGGEPRQLDRTSLGDLSIYLIRAIPPLTYANRQLTPCARCGSPVTGRRPTAVSVTKATPTPHLRPRQQNYLFVSAATTTSRTDFDARPYLVTLRRMPHPFARGDRAGRGAAVRSRQPGTRRRVPVPDGAASRARSAATSGAAAANVRPEAVARKWRAAASSAAGSGGAGSSASQRGAAQVRIDLDGIGGRVVALPGLRPGSYSQFTATPDGLLYMSQGGLKQYKLADREEKAVLDGIAAYLPTADFKKLLYRVGENWGIVTLAPAQKNDAGRLTFTGMEMRVDPRQEWEQIFHDAWLIMRDFFYDPGLHGVDWRAMYDRYHPLLAHLAHRADLDYLLGEMVGEVNVETLLRERLAGAAGACTHRC